MEKRESYDVCPVKGERLPKLGQQQGEKKVIIVAHLVEGKELSGKWSQCVGHTCLIRMVKHLEGKDHPWCLVYYKSALPGFSGAQDVNWFK